MFYLLKLFGKSWFLEFTSFPALCFFTYYKIPLNHSNGVCQIPIFMPKLGIKLQLWKISDSHILGFIFGIIHSIVINNVTHTVFRGLRTQIVCLRDEENWVELIHSFTNPFLFIHLSLQLNLLEMPSQYLFTYIVLREQHWNMCII